MGNDSVFDFSGSVAVVTGGGTGIGRATARLFADHGADVVVASRRTENLEQAAAEVRERGRRALVVTTDVRDPAACTALIDRATAEFGRIDVLVNNAGGSLAMPLEEWTLEGWENMIALNLRSVFLLCQAAASPMKAQCSGAIVNISSGAGQMGLPYVAPYGAAKAGVNNLTKALASDLAPFGVRVNCIAVGAVKSEGFVRSMARIGQDPDEVGARSTATGRAGEPEEIAWPILFLASRGASYISGETIHVGGAPAVHSLV